MEKKNMSRYNLLFSWTVTWNCSSLHSEKLSEMANETSQHSNKAVNLKVKMASCLIPSQRGPQESRVSRRALSGTDELGSGALPVGPGLSNHSHHMPLGGLREQGKSVARGEGRCTCSQTQTDPSAPVPRVLTTQLTHTGTHPRMYLPCTDKKMALLHSQAPLLFVPAIYSIFYRNHYYTNDVKFWSYWIKTGSNVVPVHFALCRSAFTWEEMLWFMCKKRNLAKHMRAYKENSNHGCFLSHLTQLFAIQSSLWLSKRGRSQSSKTTSGCGTGRCYTCYICT